MTSARCLQVLYPLLDNVKRNLEAAPAERERSGPEANILMHHSRDTARKQWSETQVLIMAGVSRVFSVRKAQLERLGGCKCTILLVGSTLTPDPIGLFSWLADSHWK